MSTSSVVSAGAKVHPWRVPGRIAYVVSYAYPYASQGYAVRTHGVATALQQHGHSVIVISRPGRPWDLAGFDDPAFPLHHEIDGVRYLTLREPSARGLTSEAWQEAAAGALEATLRVFKPSVVMAASNWENALPALKAARALGVPFFYEIRGFWEVTRASREPEWAQSPEYRQAVERKTWIARQAERVFTLNGLMRDELVRRGVPAERIELVPNGVGEWPEVVGEPAVEREALGIKSRYVVGYVGSFNPYEGLGDLIRAGARLVASGVDLSLVLVGSSRPVSVNGDCPEALAYRRLATELGVAERLMLPGRVASEGLGRFYGVMDLVVIPRRPLPVAELVSPIKPLEAAAHGKALLVSDVAPLAEFAQGAGAAVFRKGDVAHLAEQMRGLLTDEGRRRAMGEQARVWVKEQRRFRATVEPITGHFQRLASFDPKRRPTPSKSSATADVTGSLVRKTADAYSQGKFYEALDAYNQLGRLFGRELFKANIILCETRLHQSQLSKDYSSRPLQSIKMACVMDDFTFHSYEPECMLLQLTPENVVEELKQFFPDLLFIESAWRGKDELWNRKIGNLSHELKAALQWCRTNNVPTVFWNKEDPIHFETFLTTAQQFDYVFTTDIDCIARYKAALGHERVFLLPFACQPKIHNPIEHYERKDAFCFAGAYYVRYPERTRDLENYVAELPKYKPLEIFDRNHDKDDAIYKDYKFPEKFHSYIVGTLPFNEIDKAYKGYRYAINLNSIKQSQTMFARRVFELLGSNTITVSNFSRGVRMLFGDLLIASDSGQEIVRRLERLGMEGEQKQRLSGLRKVMLEHTYQHRLAYVLSKALSRPMDVLLPPMLVVAVAETTNECHRLIDSFRRQTHPDKRLLLVACSGVDVSQVQAERVEAMTLTDSPRQAIERIAELAQTATWLAPMVPADYYGANYLLDLALATRYSSTEVVGKGAHYRFSGSGLQLIDQDCAYRPVQDLAVRSSAIRVGAVPKAFFADFAWLFKLASEHWKRPGMAIDLLNYARDGQAMKPEDMARVDDLDLDSGLSCDQIVQIAENIAPAEVHDTHFPRWSSARLAEFVRSTHAQISFAINESGLQVRSSLPDGEHHYLYSNEDLPLASLPATQVLHTYLDATPGLDVQYVFVFLSQEKQKLGHVIHTSNRNHKAEVPDGTAYVRFGWRVRGSGFSTIKYLQWGHRVLDPAQMIGQGEHLLLTNQYPSYGDLYRYGFVHTRVLAYAERGVKVDIFRLRKDAAISYHEFQNVDVITGSQGALHRLLSSGRYKSVLVHFLDSAMWEVLRQFVDRLKIVVWVHGAEIQPWHRRDFNYETNQEREVARIQSDARMAFWRELLHPLPPTNLKLIFVSHYFAEEVMEDLGFRLPESSYSVIHNPIDTELFSYQPKPPEQRKKILSIRPYASKQYANDLSVNAILELSKQPFFFDLKFHIVGDGKLFDRVLKPLRQFSNVTIRRCFLTREEIAQLHKEYGVFLCPTRWDSHGVSRDEAMASGLVPLTNAVAAIPEFVDAQCGIAVLSEDSIALAEAIKSLYRNAERFSALSLAAANRVRAQSAHNLVIEQELAQFDAVNKGARDFKIQYL